MEDRRTNFLPVLWALTIVSLLINVLIVAVLVLVFMAGRQMAGALADQLEVFSKQTINYVFRITQTVPIRTSVPFQQKLVVPFQQTVAISTSVKVGKELPVIGDVEFDVPIRTSVPISISIPIDVDMTVPINTDVPINLQVPLRIPLSDTPIKDTLDQVIKVLNILAGR